MSSDGRTAVVTGAAQGLGRACCERLAADGIDVVAVDLRDSAETVASVSAHGGARCTAAICDVTDPEQVAQLRARVTRDNGTCDILVNNAGIFPPQRFDELQYEDFKRVMTVNVDSMFLMSTAFGGAMRNAGWGRIVNMGSSITQSQTRDLLAYMTSKGAVHALTRSLANELSAYGVTVNALAPSVIATEGIRDRVQNVDGMSADEEFELLTSLQSIKRRSEPSDVTNVLSFVVSDEAEFITGQILHVSGGLVRAGA